MEKNKDYFYDFVEFIVDLASDEFSSYVPCPMRYYLRHGGCLELAKVLQFFIPSTHIYFNQKEDHYIVQYNKNFYDACGLVKDLEGFQMVDQEYIQEYGELYGKGILFEGKPVHQALIQELNDCSGDYVKNLIATINKSSELDQENSKNLIKINQNDILIRKLGMQIPKQKN